MSEYTRIRTPFLNMSFTPDVPSNALGANEYNSGQNVEADVRGIKKVAGEKAILSAIPGNVFYMDGGFRDQATWVYIAATTQGKWYMITASGITNITPGVGANPSAALSGYTNDTNIVSDWVGGVFFINDTLRAPMYFRPTDTEIHLYDAAPDYFVWNYESGLSPAVTSVTAGFVRNYCSPNVGNILVAGNLTKTYSTGTTINYPTTIRWSQAFANTGVPATWLPTLNNVANEQEVPVRGPIIDGFFLGANFYVCSYWDTVVLTPIAYQNSTAPVFGVRLFNQGRGLMNNNCWVNADQTVYGIDARDIWVFDGSSFNGLGNQKVRDYFFKNLNPTYQSRMYMVNNTKKYQIEIYYPDLNSTGWCNKMLSWRYDLQVWNPPKDVQNSCMGAEGPIYQSGAFNLASRTIVYAQGSLNNSQLIQTGIGNGFNGNPIHAVFERTNIQLQTADGPVPFLSKSYLHRMAPEVSGTGLLTVTVGGSDSVAAPTTYGQAQTMSIVSSTPWVPTNQNKATLPALKIESNDSTDTWNVTAMNWQAKIVEDSF